jgi:iron complex transport system permease protein
VNTITKLGWGGVFLFTLFLIISVAVSIGSTSIALTDVWKALLHIGVSDPATETIIWNIRFPRVCVAALVGGSLAIAGVVYQSILRNPLADPYILSVSSGAAVGAVIAIISGFGATMLQSWQIPMFSFVGAIVALGCVLLLSQFALQVQSLLLAGVVVNALFGAILTFLLSTSPTEMARIQFWLMGGFTLRQWEHVALLIPVSAIAGILLWISSRELNLFAMSSTLAAQLGVSVRRMRLWLLLIASLLTAIAVSISGMIGFVGLIIPHLVRIVIRSPDHRFVLPYSFLIGAIFLVSSDALSRILFAPTEIPVGVITATIGAPVFAYFLRKTLVAKR